jgi:predicted Zn-dependent peptidase
MSSQIKAIVLYVMQAFIAASLPFLTAATTEGTENPAKSDMAAFEHAAHVIDTERGTLFFDELEGGTRVLLLEIPSAPVTYGMISVKVGGRYESVQHAGISHLLEHLMFKEHGENSRLEHIRMTGGSVNAVTDMELTSYYFTVLPQHFDQSLSALTALVTEPVFTEQDLESEREVVLEELAQGMNDPRALVLTQLVKQIFPDSPMNSFVIGTKESIEAITYDQLRDFYNTYYTPANMTIVAAGRLNAVKTMQRLRALYGEMDRQPAPTSQFEVPQPAMNRLTKKIPIKQSFFIYGFLTPGKNSADFFAMEVFDILFASGVHSRLQRRIVIEQGYTEQIYPNWYSYSNTGIWAVFLSVHPDDIGAVRELVDEEMQVLTEGRFGESELAAAKRALATRMRLNLDKPEDLAWFHLENLTYSNRIMTAGEYVKALEQVGVEDIMRIGRTYCADDRTITIEMTPAKGVERLYILLKYLTTKTL